MNNTSYFQALKALDWLNRNTDYRSNNISGEYPTYFRWDCGGMFGLSNFLTKESLGILTGTELVELATKEGWKDDERRRVGMESSR
jgi:hypothetical protein